MLNYQMGKNRNRKNKNKSKYSNNESTSTSTSTSTSISKSISNSDFPNTEEIMAMKFTDGTHNTSPKYNICLNMIVKDEGHIIESTLINILDF